MAIWGVTLKTFLLYCTSGMVEIYLTLTALNSCYSRHGLPVYSDHLSIAVTTATVPLLTTTGRLDSITYCSSK